MFRETKPTAMNLDNFGVGSVIQTSPDFNWLVVCEENAVGLLNLSTFEILPQSLAVDDPNFLTEDEARHIVRFAEESYTFSDFSIYPSGLKGWRFHRVSDVTGRADLAIAKGITKM